MSISLHLTHLTAAIQEASRLDSAVKMLFPNEDRNHGSFFHYGDSWGNRQIEIIDCVLEHSIALSKSGGNFNGLIGFCSARILMALLRWQWDGKLSINHDAWHDEFKDIVLDDVYDIDVVVDTTQWLAELVDVPAQQQVRAMMMRKLTMP